MSVLIEDLLKLEELLKEQYKSIPESVSDDSDINKLVKFYLAINERIKSLLFLGKQSKLFNFEMNTIKKMKHDFSEYWNNLSITKQNMLVNKLIESKIIPVLIIESLKIFGGRLTGII